MVHNKDTIHTPINETLAASQQEVAIGENTTFDTDILQKDTQEGIAETLALSHFLTPDPEMWGDMSPIDPVVIQKKKKTNDIPIINWDFDKNEKAKHTPSVTSVTKGSPSYFSMEEIIRRGPKKITHTEIITSDITSTIDVQEGMCLGISLDPFEQANPDILRNPELNFYINRFREIFQGSESDNQKEGHRRYTRILLYLLEEFDIRAQDTQKVKQKKRNIQILRKELSTGEEQQNEGVLSIPKKVYPILSEQSRKELEDRYSFYEQYYIFDYIERHEKETTSVQKEIEKGERIISSFQERIGKLKRYIQKHGNHVVTPDMKSAIEKADRLLHEREHIRIKNLHILLQGYAKVLLYILEKFPIGGEYKNKNRSMQILFETLGFHSRCDELMHELDTIIAEDKTPKKIYFSPTIDSLHTLGECYKKYSTLYRESKKQFKQEQDKKEKRRMKQLAEKIANIEEEVFSDIFEEMLFGGD